METTEARAAPSRLLPWWAIPFLGSIGAILGLLLLFAVVSLLLGTPSCDLKIKLDRPLLPFDPERRPDLDVAPGAPGYIASLGLAGHQFHFEDKEARKTWIAVDMWLHGVPLRIAVAGYDGPPDPGLAADLVRPLDPFLPMLVVGVEGATEVWCDACGPVADRDVQVGAPDGRQTYMEPNRADAGQLNLLVFPGKVALWTRDGPRHEIEVGSAEHVWCTLGPKGLVVERREATAPGRSR